MQQSSVVRRVEKILFVDDNELALKSWARAAKRLDRTPILATNRLDAIEIAMREEPELAVIDLVMPGDTGFAVLRDLSLLDLSMTKLLISGAMCVEYAMLGVAAGADDCFDREVPLEQLIERAERGERVEPNELSLPPLKEVEWGHIVRAVNECSGNITHAAKALGIARQTLQRKIKERGSGVLRPDAVPRRPKPNNAG